MSKPSPPPGLSDELGRYLQDARDTVLRGLAGLSEYDSRRPLTSSGSNILGLIKHLAGVEVSYLGECVGRQPPVHLPWVTDGSIWEGADMWVTTGQSREYIVELYRSAWKHSDESLLALPLDAPAYVSWWPAGQRNTTMGHLLVRVVAETAQHAGHIDILRENMDGQGGRDHDEQGDAEYWVGYVAAIQRAANPYRR